MRVCSYASVFVFTAFVAAVQLSGCATKGSPPAETAATETTMDPAAGEPDMADPAAGEEPASDTSDTGGAADPSAPASDSAAGAGTSGSAPGAAAPASGGSDRDLTQIQKLVSDNRKPVRACYDKARKELPNLKGSLTIKFVIDPQGKVKTAELNLERSEIKAPDVVNCAIETIKNIQFPPSAKGMETTVNYPFDFKP